MTVPDRPVQDVIAEAVAEALPESLLPVGAGLRFPWWAGRSHAGQLTAYGRQIVDAVVPAVVAACREATVTQQAELLGGEVAEGVATDGNHLRFARGPIEWVGPS